MINLDSENISLPTIIPTQSGDPNVCDFYVESSNKPNERGILAKPTNCILTY